MERLRGVVERITYANAETGYSVIKIAVKGFSDLVTVVGSMASVAVGTVVEVRGRWTQNPKFGRQFEAKEWEETLPASIYGIEKYLGSGLIKGIGPVFAQKIVGEFQEQTLDVLEDAPESLLAIEGIGPKRLQMIKTAWAEQKEIKNIMVFLQSHGVSTAFGSKIYRAYGEKSIEVITENPYQMAEDIFGVGFKTADELAQKLGIDPESDMRCRSGVIYVLRRLADDGHCYAEPEQLVTTASELLEITPAHVTAAVEQLIHNEEIIVDADVYYLPPFFHSEAGTARRLRQIAQAGRRHEPKPSQQLLTGADIAYDEVQQRAIQRAQTAKVMVLTGGPGTGKTTTLQGIINLYQTSQMQVLLAAPTGRAAKRMTEATGLAAKTIHRLLEFRPGEGYQRNQDNPLEGDLLIVDEASMIDIILMHNLLKALPDTMALLLVGDVHQLPSVGPGNVLADIITSNTVPVIILERIFRQALGSRIITNAHRILQGQQPDLRASQGSDFYFLEETENLADTIVQLCSQRLPRYFGVDAVRDIQVLTPMQRTETGAANLNALLQNALNKQTQCLRRGSMEFRLHDKVMQLRNNYEKDVFNGDIGRISAVDADAGCLAVEFDGRTVEYETLELDELVLAYATTIHKAQGSEYPVVVIPFSFSHYIMLRRNLLYTAITRAQRLVVLVGERRAVYTAVRSAHVEKRNTRLAQRLAAVWGLNP